MCLGGYPAHPKLTYHRALREGPSLEKELIASSGAKKKGGTKKWKTFLFLRTEDMEQEREDFKREFIKAKHDTFNKVFEDSANENLPKIDQTSHDERETI